MVGDRRQEGEREKEGYASILSHMPQVVSRSVVVLEAKKGTPVIRARIAVCAAARCGRGAPGRTR